MKISKSSKEGETYIRMFFDMPDHHVAGARKIALYFLSRFRPFLPQKVPPTKGVRIRDSGNCSDYMKRYNFATGPADGGHLSGQYAPVFVRNPSLLFFAPISAILFWRPKALSVGGQKVFSVILEAFWGSAEKKCRRLGRFHAHPTCFMFVH